MDFGTIGNAIFAFGIVLAIFAIVAVYNHFTPSKYLPPLTNAEHRMVCEMETSGATVVVSQRKGHVFSAKYSTGARMVDCESDDPGSAVRVLHDTWKAEQGET